MSRDHKYISCIKIGGTPLIPPLITPKRREECLKYKIQAIELEKKKERDRLFKKCMEDLARLEIQTKDLSKFDELPSPIQTTLENQLAFAEVAEINTKSPSHVPYATYKKMQNLKRETIDVSEYRDEGVKMINKPEPVIDKTPKLIRSNSYTLDSPSPILLAHLEKEAKKCVEIDSDSESSSPVTIIDSETEPRQMQLIETDISIQEVSVSTPTSTEIRKSDLEPQLLAVLDKLPNDHATNIIRILEKQQEEQMKNKLLAEQLVIEEKPLNVSISSSHSLLYSFLNSPGTPVSRGKSPEDELRVVNLKNIKNKSDVAAKRERAASIIGAAVKGFLVRRLIQTEKVQSLVDTIKDALLCAIQLHGAEVIEEADVELHRRLIQQVSAACYAFHDIFFSLSTKEQMGIIALDRQRRIEKASRPLSSGSNISISRRSRESARR